MSSRAPGRSPQQWSKIIAESRQGSESEAEFCRRLNLKLATFRKHKYADGNLQTRSPAFSEVRVTSVPGMITVRTSDGVAVEVPVSVGMSAVAQLVQALQHER